MIKWHSNASVVGVYYAIYNSSTVAAVGDFFVLDYYYY